MLGVANEREMRVKNEGEMTGCISDDYTVIPSEVEESRYDAFRCALRAPSTALRFARDDGYSVRQKSWKRSKTLFDHVEARRVTEPNGAIVPERSARARPRHWLC